MCNRYRPARGDELDLGYEPEFITGPRDSQVLFTKDIGPYQRGVFVRERDGRLEEVAAQWGLIGPFWKAPLPEKIKGRWRYLTNNARFETIAELPTYKGAWARGQRCLIPAAWHVEPCWETGANVWWRFRLRGPTAYALAGIWSEWTDRETGEVFPSYSMVTLNADAHPLFSRMHRPDPTRPETMQDKRAVVPLPPSASRAWLTGTIEEASAVLTLPDERDIEAAPEGKEAQPVLL
jgi:putative SOS response-associated peptidase YedK